MADDLLHVTERGLCCRAGDFYIDPWRPVERAVVTHAHADHAAWGCEHYLTSSPGEGVLRQRVGAEARIQSLPYGEPIEINGVRVSLHPAGHILGSAQIRVEHAGRVWVVSGDYKTDADPTCDTFEPVRCDVFITEATFGLPIFTWRPQAEVFGRINDWWRANQQAGRTSVLLAYALGKSQRVLAGVDPTIGPIFLHGAQRRFDEPYRAAGIELPASEHATAAAVKAAEGQALVLAPPSAAGSPWLRKLGPSSSAMVSGWMRIRGTRRRRSLDRGFVLSDHADFGQLMHTIEATGAERIGVTHGYTQPLARYLTETGREAFVLPTRYTGESDDETEHEAVDEKAGS
jgi:putative mRNA 3-end processing factor